MKRNYTSLSRKFGTETAQRRNAEPKCYNAQIRRREVTKHKRKARNVRCMNPAPELDMKKLQQTLCVCQLKYIRCCVCAFHFWVDNPSIDLDLTVELRLQVLMIC